MKHFGFVTLFTSYEIHKYICIEDSVLEFEPDFEFLFRPGKILLVLCISTGQETYESFWEVVFQTRKQLCLPSALALLITQFLLQGSAAHGDLSSVEGQVMCSLNSLPFCLSLWNQQVHMYWSIRIRTWILGKVWSSNEDTSGHQEQWNGTTKILDP